MDNPSSLVASGVTAHLSIKDGRAAEAIEFYKKAFDAQEVTRIPADNGKLMHAHLTVNGGDLMLADAFPERGYPGRPIGGFTLHLQVDDADAWWNRALAAGAKELMPIGDQFWGDRYGQLRDPFDVDWSVGSPTRK